MKNMLQGMALISLSFSFGLQASAATPVAPQVQMLIQSCDSPNNSNLAKSIEVYGVLDETTGTISNLAVLEVVSFDVGDLKMIVQGGDITGVPGSDIVYNNILGGDASLSIKANVGTVTYKGQQTIFAHCR